MVLGTWAYFVVIGRPHQRGGGTFTCLIPVYLLSKMVYGDAFCIRLPVLVGVGPVNIGIVGRVDSSQKCSSLLFGPSSLVFTD